MLKASSIALLSAALALVVSCGSDDKHATPSAGGSSGTSAAGSAGASGAAGTSSGTSGKGGKAGSSGTSGANGVSGASGIGAGGTEATPCSSEEDCPGHPTCTSRTCLEGTCSATPAHEGDACDDGDGCTEDGVCKQGVCLRGPPKDCSASAGPCQIGACDIQTGCTFVPLPDGTQCSDGLACTQDDVCTGGACVGGAQVGCLSTECSVGMCTEPDGECVQDSSGTDGQGCSVDACSASASCEGGSCNQSGEVGCQNFDGCCPSFCGPGNDNDCAFSPAR